MDRSPDNAGDRDEQSMTNGGGTARFIFLPCSQAVTKLIYGPASHSAAAASDAGGEQKRRSCEQAGSEQKRIGLDAIIGQPLNNRVADFVLRGSSGRLDIAAAHLPLRGEAGVSKEREQGRL